MAPWKKPLGIKRHGLESNDLIAVCLNRHQRRAFQIRSQPDKYQTLKSPIWHDSNTRLVGSGFDDAGDRKFKYQGGSAFKQKVAPVFGMTYTGSLPFLLQYPTPQTDAHGNKILRGTIDMKGYSAWLKTNYGLDIAY